MLLISSNVLTVLTKQVRSYDVISKIRLLHSMHIYVKNIPAKFHPGPI